ncbi:hypothetical protein [uncultured Thiocystis sp.]|jgi:hypothetical protein|uniref:hypothetical protein n=1 Tax=uncultured Thiocystis sp. TaxID=1202134 RepID=UPI0025ECE779|nr:hypothetical protein [uncultured Thiocystis sp.]
MLNLKPSLATLTLAIGSLTATTPALAAVDPFDGGWHFTLTPYLWAPNINGSLDTRVTGLASRVAGLADNAELNLSTKIGPNDYLENLKFGIMLTGEVRKGNWSAFTDIIYIDFGNQDARVRDITGPRGRDLTAINANATINLDSTVWTLAGAYTVACGPIGNFDVLAGFRYVGIDTELKWSLHGSRDLLDASGRDSHDLAEWDGIVGVKGQVRLGDGYWLLPYYLDVGTGSSNLTWQALVGVGYGFDWGDVTLSIRSLSYDFNEKDADLRMTGPALGVNFRW